MTYGRIVTEAEQRSVPVGAVMHSRIVEVGGFGSAEIPMEELDKHREKGMVMASGGRMTGRNASLPRRSVL